MEQLLAALNSLVAGGVVTNYAIGGAVGASFYMEAQQTEDVDAFVYLPESSSGLVSLQPIYDALTALGGVVEGAHVRIGAWPLQILSDANALIREAIRDAVTVPFRDVNTRVFRAEHLFAIALQTGRAKDYVRARLLVERGAVRVDRVQALLERHGLLDRLAKVSDAM